MEKFQPGLRFLHVISPLDKHAPVKSKCIRGDQLPWITPHLQREISYRNRLFKLHKKNPTQVSWELFRKQRNKVTSLKRKGMKVFCIDACTNLKHHGEFWKKMKPLLPGKDKSKSKIVLFENDRVVNDSLEVAEIFNKFFCDTAVCDGNCSDINDFADHPSINLIAHRHPSQPQFNFVQITEDYIKTILINLDPTKSVGCDNISQRLLRLASPVIAEPLTKMINFFIVNRAWPIVWRSSNVAPVYKKDDEMNKGNYRPVSVLPAVSKVYEKVLYDEIYNAFNPIMSANLSGFCKGHLANES